MDSQRPAWLRAQENGTLGEARTKAFLLDRFWILERSVDIEGADLIIQRRAKRSLLDPKPPNLGYVQTKYFHDANTTQYVHLEYVLDPHGDVRSEFFLICHTGIADESHMFLLSAKDIHENFQITDSESARPNCFAIPGRVILEARWRTTDKKKSLDQMEQALINADFASNRRFLSWVLPNEPNDLIAPEYAHDIDCWDGGIRQSFFKLREQAEGEAWELIKRLDLLATIANTNDPLVAVESARDITHLDQRRDGFYSEDFERALRREKEWYELLSEAGLLPAHNSLKEVLRRKIIDDSVVNFPFSPESFFLVEISFDVKTLVLRSFATRLADKSTTRLNILNSCSDHVGIEETPPGFVRGFILWSRFFDPGDIILEDFDPGGIIAGWVEHLLSYMMFDILDKWRFEHSYPTHV